MDDTRDEVDEILAGMTGGRTGTAGRFCVERENIECRKKEEAEEQP